MFPQPQKVLLDSAAVDEGVSLSRGMRAAGKSGAAQCKVCGTSHLFLLGPRLWEEEVKDQHFPQH